MSMKVGMESVSMWRRPMEALSSDGVKELHRLQAENAKLRKLLQMALDSHYKMCTNRGTCEGCLFFKAKPFAPACPIIGVTREARELEVEVRHYDIDGAD